MSGHDVRVSIGVPVFNGERYLSQALDSILAQTFRDFEVIVCDNASSDRTHEIASAYAARDGRVRFIRNEINIGAAANFNLAFSHARGEYFKWAAHDDVIAPRFLEQCVSALDHHPDAILSYPQTIIIDQEGKHLQHHSHKLETDSDIPSRRFHELLGGHKCYEVFGVIRTSALRRTPLMGNYGHGDGVLLARLALLGKFVEVPEPLFLARQHPDQSMQVHRRGYHSYSEWFDPHKRNKIIFPRWRMFGEFIRSVTMYNLNLRERFRCLVSLVRWIGIYYKSLIKDLVVATTTVMSLPVRRVLGRTSGIQRRA